ncbi:hypothetical protein EOD29_33080, partial [Mesorhizobium sp. M1A.T.Ca.IN.004.03.1.1]
GDADLSSELPGYGYAYFYVETDPAKVARFYALVDEIAKDLRSRDVSPPSSARAASAAASAFRAGRCGRNISSPSSAASSSSARSG